jgi:RNA polymerase primary sigma factor
MGAALKASYPSPFFVEEGSLALYLRDISKHHALSAEEEYRTAVRIKQGDPKALEKLIKANLRFVVSVARNYQNQGMSLADLINEGNLGLIRAAKRFDEKKNFKFISYAVWWIRQAILQGLADHSRIVKVPVNRVATIHKVGKVRTRLEQRFRRMPNEAEVADELGITVDEVKSSLRIGTRHASLDAPVSQGRDGAFIDLMHDRSEENPDEYVVKRSLNSEVDKLLDTLSEREQSVVRLYFGIGEDTNYTLEEIGLRSNITRERVRQIKETALKKLKRSGRIGRLRRYV